MQQKILNRNSVVIINKNEFEMDFELIIELSTTSNVAVEIPGYNIIYIKILLTRYFFRGYAVSIIYHFKVITTK